MPEKDDFDDLKSDFSYNACVGGIALGGLALGGFLGQPVLGAAGGLIWGLMTCNKIQEPLKQKLFSSKAILHDNEIRLLLGEIRNLRPYISNHEALKTLASIRREMSANPGQYRKKTINV